MTNEQLDIEKHVEYFHQQLEEARLSPRQLYAMVNLLTREVAKRNGHFNSLEHFHNFKHENLQNLED